MHQNYMKREADLIIEENELYENKNNNQIELIEQVEQLEKIIEEKNEMIQNIKKKMSQCKKVLLKEDMMSRELK